MARDLNRIMDDMRHAREVFVTEDGRIEDASEAEENESQEASEGAPKARTRLKPEVFGDLHTIRVTMGALDKMHTEASRFDDETGGIVIGPNGDTITDLIPSGPNAGRTISSFELDAAYLQPRLEHAEDHGKRFLGIWHVHPSGFAELSATDHRAAMHILSDPDWNVSRLLLPLSVRCKSGFHTEVFVAHLGGGRLQIQPARLRVTSSSQRGGCQLMAPLPPPKSRPISASAPESCAVRLAKDCRKLQNAGWFCSLKSLTSKDLVLTASRNGVELMLFVPPEYPLSPPEVMASSDNHLKIVPFAELPETDRWSSRRSLVDVVSEAELFVTRELLPQPSRMRRALARFWRGPLVPAAVEEV